MDHVLSRLALRFETSMCLPVTYKKKKVVISGNADFSLWYDDDDEPMATNLVCVEVRKEEGIGLAEGPIVAYMGMCGITSARELY